MPDYSNVRNLLASGMYGMYNTPLSPTEQASFRNWAAQRYKTTGRNPLNDMYDYDVQGFWKSGAANAANGHGTDLFKKPNHPTFSNESMYAGQAGPAGQPMTGGRWFPNSYQPSPTNLQSHSPQELSSYFRQVEPDYHLLLPPAPLRSPIPAQLGDFLK